MHRGLAAFAKAELAECGDLLQGESEGKVEHFELIYDAWNRLVKVMNYDNDKEVQRNEYDGFNRRIVRKEYSLTSGTLNETRHFYYNRELSPTEF